MKTDPCCQSSVTVGGLASPDAGVTTLPVSFTLVTEGDSRTSIAGGGLSAGQEWPAKIITMSAFTGRVTLVNSAVGGSGLGAMAARYAASVYPYRPAATGKPALLIIGPSDNDIPSGTAGATAAANLIAYCDTAIADGFTLCVCTNPLRLTAGWTTAINTEWHVYNSAIRVYANSANIRLIDVAQLLPDPRETAYFNVDVLHFNATGALKVAEYINYLFQLSKTPLLESSGGFNSYYLRSVDGTFTSQLRVGPTPRGNAPLSVSTWATPDGCISMNPDDAGFNDASGCSWRVRGTPAAAARSFSLFANVDASGQLTLKQSSTNTGDPDTIRMSVLASGVVDFPAAVSYSPVAQTATTAAVSITTTATALTTTAPAQAITLADGVNGQIKIIAHVAKSGGGTAVLTPATKTGYTTITFTNVGETATLQFFTTVGWLIIGLRGAVAA
jgi:hypothetical protein